MFGESGEGGINGLVGFLLIARYLWFYRRTLGWKWKDETRGGGGIEEDGRRD